VTPSIIVPNNINPFFDITARLISDLFRDGSASVWNEIIVCPSNRNNPSLEVTMREYFLLKAKIFTIGDLKEPLATGTATVDLIFNVDNPNWLVCV